MADQILKVPAVASEPIDPNNLWTLTWSRIDRFFPRLKDDFTALPSHDDHV